MDHHLSWLKWEQNCISWNIFLFSSVHSTQVIHVFHALINTWKRKSDFGASHLNSLWVCGSYFVLNILVHIQVCWCGKSSQKAKCLLKVNQIVKLSVRFLRETDFIDHTWHRILCTKSCTAAGMRFVALVFLWYCITLFSIANVYLKIILKNWGNETFTLWHPRYLSLCFSQVVSKFTEALFLLTIASNKYKAHNLYDSSTPSLVLSISV